MTQNQLKYWELRWRQHYDMLQHQVDLAKVEVELAKLQETARHNKAQERIATQELVLTRVKLSQEWEKMQFDMKATIVRLGLEYNGFLQKNVELQQKNRALDQEDVRLNQKYIELGQEADKIMTNKFVQVTDAYTEILQGNYKNQTERMKALADSVGPLAKSVGIGFVASTLGMFDSYLSNTQASEAFWSSLEKTYPSVFKDLSQEVAETYAPKVKAMAKSYTELYGPQGLEQASKDISAYLNKMDPKADDLKRIATQSTVTGHTNTQNVNESIGTSVQKGSSGASFYENHRDARSTRGPIETKNSAGTSVVYSGGSHYGPGY